MSAVWLYGESFFPFLFLSVLLTGKRYNCIMYDKIHALWVKTRMFFIWHFDRDHMSSHEIPILHKICLKWRWWAYFWWIFSHIKMNKLETKQCLNLNTPMFSFLLKIQKVKVAVTNYVTLMRFFALKARFQVVLVTFFDFMEFITLIL